MKLTGRTLVVASDGTADYLDISDAINQARRGDTIEVMPGDYFGPLEVSFDVCLRSVAGPKATRVIALNTSALVIGECAAIIQGFAFESRSDSPNANFHGVKILGGVPTLRNCRAKSNSSACFSILGTGNLFLLEQCLAVNGGGEGIVLYDRAKGTLFSCEAKENAEAGFVFSDEGTTISARHAKASFNAGQGFLIENEASPTLVFARSIGNRGNSYEITGEHSRPRFAHCHELNNAGRCCVVDNAVLYLTVDGKGSLSMDESSGGRVIRS